MINFLIKYCKSVEEFIREHLPEKLKNLVDFSSIKRENNSFDDELLGKNEVDVLFSAKFADSIGYISIILEHQSRPDIHMAYRLRKYSMMIWGAYLEKYPKSKYLPVVFPIVLYTGKMNYKAPKNFVDLFENPDLAKEILSSDYKLIDISNIPDEEFVNKGILSPIYFVSKYIKDTNLSKKLDNIKQDLKLLSGKYELYFQRFFRYTIRNTDDPNPEGILEVFIECATFEKQKEKVMNIAKRLENKGVDKGINIGIGIGREEGKEEGKEEGAILTKQEIARALLATGQSIEYISMVTGLTLEEVRNLLI